MKLLLRASLLSLGLAACTDAADDTGPATTGIYRLQAQPLVLTCDPLDTQTEWTVALIRSANSLSYAVPDSAPQLGTLARRETDAALRAEYESTLAGSCARGTYHDRFQVDAESPDRVDALLDQAWSDVVRCPGDPVDELLPPTACRTQRALTYELVEPCEAPCEMIHDADDQLVCAC